ncbi:hypothetical protein D3C75_1016780 [compost metagenome]
MALGKQPAIEKHTAGNVRLSFMMARQQLLGDAVTIIMSEQVHRLIDLQVLKQGLLQVGLFDQAVKMMHRFGRVAKTKHVTGYHPVSLGQWRPQVMPIPARRGKSVDKQQRLALPCRPVANGLTAEGKTQAPGTPDT